MPVPQGFVELNPVPWAGGPFRVTQRDANGNDIFPFTYPAFWRGRVLWSPTGAIEGVPLEDQYHWPSWTLYGGPTMLGWAGQKGPGVRSDITAYLAQWAATLPRKSPAGAWVILEQNPALLTPAEARPYPRTAFLWSWSWEPDMPPRYNIEGVKVAPLFRNTVTMQFDNPDFPMAPSPQVSA